MVELSLLTITTFRDQSFSTMFIYFIFIKSRVLCPMRNELNVCAWCKRLQTTITYLVICVLLFFKSRYWWENQFGGHSLGVDVDVM